MQERQPIFQFGGTLKDRSTGRSDAWPPSAKVLMEKVPAWPDFIKSVTSWDYVRPGTMTLDETTPRPKDVLDDVTCLGTEPDDLFDNDASDHAKFLRSLHIKRGPRTYYGGFAHFAKQDHIVIVSQQPNPACLHRLEVYSNVKLRDTLRAETDDTIYVDIFHKDDWFQLKKETKGWGVLA